MSVAEVKKQVQNFSLPDRRELVAFIHDLDHETRETEALELARFHDEMDAGMRVSFDELLRQHEDLKAQGR